MSAAYMRRCAGKIRYESREKAGEHKASLAANKDKKTVVYRCDQCLGYHVGGPSGVFVSRNRRSGKRANKRMRGR